jgi:hypothetical protein
MKHSQQTSLLDLITDTHRADKGQLTIMDADIDPCAVCGLSNVIDGDDPAAHWDTPTGATIVAWTCSAACTAAMEARRSEARIAAMSNRELADVIEGRTRIGDTQAEQLTAWNLAIDEETNRS